MAREENLDVESDLLKAILENLPQDTDWDESQPRQKAFKAAGEKSYLFARSNMSQWSAQVDNKQDGQVRLHEGQDRSQDFR